MNENPPDTEKTDNRRFDPELLKKGLRCDLDQYYMLKRCSDKKDMTEWNQWRKDNPKEEIILESAYFKKWHLESANFNDAKLKRAKFNFAYVKNCTFIDANLESAIFYKAHLQCSNLRTVLTNGQTSFWQSDVDRATDFSGVALGSVRINPQIKLLLEYNIRRKNWGKWYKEHRILKWPVKLFWSFSDYGRSTWRIISWFFGLALAFALVYWLVPNCVKVYGNVGDIRGYWHALYFSIVTMTTLGFGDIAANPDSWLGQTLLMIQVILGYVLLGALITRFAVLFTAGGPAGKFADEKTISDRLKQLWTKPKGRNAKRS